MSILLVALSVLFLGRQVLICISMDDSNLIVNHFPTYLTREQPINLGKYTDSFNMIIGMKNEEINLFDNPYFSVNVYDYNEKYQLTKSSVQLKHC